MHVNENVSQLVAELVSIVNGSIEKHGHIVGHMCATCVRVFENVHAHSRTQVEQQVAELVASVNGSVEQHGEYKFSNKFSNLLLNLLSKIWLV